MNILAVDTSTKSCGVAVIRNNIVISELYNYSNTTHSKQLLELIDSALSIAALDIDDINGFSVCTGPGSFTGLRIGLSMVKGLASINNLPVAGVSSLDALASNIAYTDACIIPVIDARKGEVYTAGYKYSNAAELIKSGHEDVVSPCSLLENLVSKSIFIGSGTKLLLDLPLGVNNKNVIIPEEAFHNIRPSTIGMLGAKEMSEISTNSYLSDIIPNYIRKSDAEINWKKI